MPSLLTVHALPVSLMLNVVLTLAIILAWRRWSSTHRRTLAHATTMRRQMRRWRNIAWRVRSQLDLLRGEIAAWRHFKTRTPSKPPPLPTFPPPLPPELRPATETGWGDSHLETEIAVEEEPFDRRATLVRRRD